MTQNVTGGIATTMNVSVNPTNEDFGRGFASNDHGSAVVDGQRSGAHGERCDH